MLVTDIHCLPAFITQNHMDHAEFLHLESSFCRACKTHKTSNLGRGRSYCGEQGPAHRALLHNESLFSQRQAFNLELHL